MQKFKEYDEWKVFKKSLKPCKSPCLEDENPREGSPIATYLGSEISPTPPPAPSEHSRHTTPAQSQAPSPDYDDEDDESDLEEGDADLDLLVHWDSQKTQYVNDPEDKGEGEVVDDEDDEDDEESQEWKGFGKEELLVK